MEAPAFSNPVYGDEQTVTVEPGKESVTRLFCQQVNSGVRISFDPDLLSRDPEASVSITSGDALLVYGAGKSRIAYFAPDRLISTL